MNHRAKSVNDIVLHRKIYFYLRIMENLKPEGKKKIWLKRAGIGAFLFFLAKGLVWLAVFFFAAKSCS